MERFDKKEDGTSQKTDCGYCKKKKKRKIQGKRFSNKRGPEEIHSSLGFQRFTSGIVKWKECGENDSYTRKRRKILFSNLTCYG